MTARLWKTEALFSCNGLSVLGLSLSLVLTAWMNKPAFIGFYYL
jgi:hypothetical protein